MNTNRSPGYSLKRICLLLAGLAALGAGIPAVLQADTYRWVSSELPNASSTTTGVRNYGTAVFGTNAVYVTGAFNGSNVTVGAFVFTNLSPSSLSTYDIILAKYDASGTCLWATNAGGNRDDLSYSVSVDGAGSVYITGFYASTTATFGTNTITKTAGTTQRDIFIAKYNASGTCLWARSAGAATLLDEANGVAALPGGGAYIAGGFEGATATFGSIVVTNALGGAGQRQPFLVRYDSTGGVVWGTAGASVDLSGFGEDEAGAVAVTPDGGAVMSGYFYSTNLMFGAYALTNANQVSVSSDIFLARYASNGTCQWALSVGGVASDGATVLSGVSVDNATNIYLSSEFKSGTNFMGSLSVTNLGPALNRTDAFVGKVSPTGVPIWLCSGGGADNDEGYYGCSAVSTGGVTVVGSVRSTNAIFGTNVFNKVGNFDVVVVRYDSTGAVLAATLAGGATLDDGLAIADAGGGTWYVAGSTDSTNSLFGAFTAPVVPGKASGFLARLDSGTGAVVVAVSAPAITILSGATEAQTNGMRFSFPTTVGLTYSVQWSTNLLGWTTLTNVAGAGSTYSFTHPVSG